MGVSIVIILLFAFSIGILPAFMALKMKRNFFIWWIYGSLLFPIALAHIYWLKNGLPLFRSSGSKRCGFCRTVVDVNAAHCPHCGYDFTTMGY